MIRALLGLMSLLVVLGLGTGWVLALMGVL